MRRLVGFSFEWVLPGHGQRVHLSHGDMRLRMEELVTRLNRNA